MLEIYLWRHHSWNFYSTVTIQELTLLPHWVILLAKCLQDCWGDSMYTWRYCDPSNLEGSVAVSVVEHVTMCIREGGMSGSSD